MDNDRIIRLADLEPQPETSAEPESPADGADGADGFPTRQKVRVLIDEPNPDVTVEGLRDALATEADTLYDLGVPVRIVFGPDGRPTAQILKTASLIQVAHKCCRPYKRTQEGEADTKVPVWAADMYLQDQGNWRLRPLNGITSAALLREDGSFFCESGYDPETGLYVHDAPNLDDLLPAQPSRDDAQEALLALRHLLRTFPFADANLVLEPETGMTVVDQSQPPRKDESAALAALLTAVCRSSLPLAPAVLVTAPKLSGAGSGKGKFARLIYLVATGNEPAAVTSGGSREELDKRIGSVLMTGSDVLFIDNVNDTKLKSDTLASVITETPAHVRLLGKSEMVPLAARAVIVITGNGLSVAEDLARRSLLVKLDPKTEDAESRYFDRDVLEVARECRGELLAACLTILRYGRVSALLAGRPWGSFETWARWVRDPLIDLGCLDPAVRLADIKRDDDERQLHCEILEAWYSAHGSEPVKVAMLADTVKALIVPEAPTDHKVAARVSRMVDARVGGMYLKVHPSSGGRGRQYSVVRLDPENHQHHQHHLHPDNAEAEGGGAIDDGSMVWRGRL
jgi:hypothetical protein